MAGRAIPLLLLLALCAQLTLAIPQLSLTYDEPIYTGIGYADLTTQNLYLHGIIGHGPLVPMLTAWPLLLDPYRPDVTRLDPWGTESSLGLGRAVLAALGPLARTTFVTRLPVTWLTLLLAALVYRWARQAMDTQTASLALLIFVFEPNVLAHGSLNTTDIGVTTCGFVSSYLLARFLRRPRALTALGVGVALGAAMAAKASGLFWVGAAGLVTLVFAWRTNQHPVRALLIWGLRLAAVLCIALLAHWAIHLFELRPLSPGGMPVPAASYWEGFPYLRSYLATGQLTFLAGELHAGGHWSYFPISFLLKTPLPLLLALALAVVAAIARGVGPRWHAIPLILTPLAYFGISISAGLNIGHRHLLPLLPYLAIFVGQGIRKSLAPGRTHQGTGLGRTGAIKAAGYLVAILYALGALRMFPHYLAYFNVIAGGPDGGSRFLADSSLDWGQALLAMDNYLEENPGTPVRLAAFSSIDPGIYDLDYEPIPPTVDAPITLSSRFRPEPGRYVLSVVPLQGVWLLDPDTYDWFRHREPIAKVGHVLYVYDVPATQDAPTRVVQCASPLPVLDDAALEEGFGKLEISAQNTFDCEQGWLYPGGGGWLVLPGTEPASEWISERIGSLVPTFRQHDHWSHPALSLYEVPSDAAETISTARDPIVAPSDWLPQAAVQDGIQATGDVATDGPLTFLGYALESDREGLTAATFWRVEGNTGRPLSLMAHLLTGDGEAIAIGDGLAVPVESWQVGDVIVQRHCLLYPDGRTGGPYYVQFGVYWLDTMERWPLSVGGTVAGDRMLAPETVP